MSGSVSFSVTLTTSKYSVSPEYPRSFSQIFRIMFFMSYLLKLIPASALRTASALSFRFPAVFSVFHKIHQTPESETVFTVNLLPFDESSVFRPSYNPFFPSVRENEKTISVFSAAGKINADSSLPFGQIKEETSSGNLSIPVFFKEIRREIFHKKPPKKKGTTKGCREAFHDARKYSV